MKFATSGARYAMPGLAALESKARQILDAETDGKKKGEEKGEEKPASADSDQTSRSADTAAGASPAESGAEVPLNERRKRKPTPPPFDPVTAESGNSSKVPKKKIAERIQQKREEEGSETSAKHKASSSSTAGAKKSSAPKRPKEAEKSAKRTQSKSRSEPKPPPSGESETLPTGADEVSEEESAWHNEIFDESWISLEPRSASFHAREDIRFLVKHCEVPRQGKILDLGCGTGRHAMEMASAGYEVVGLDRSRLYLEKAVEEANRSDLKIRFVEGDMRSFSFPPAFDAITSFHTSFGYFSDRQNKKSLRCMASCLAPEGQLIIDVVNRDWVASIGARRLWWEHRGYLVMEDVLFHDDTGRLEVERTVVGENAPRWDQKFSIRLYTVAEYAALFREVGLELVDITGNLAHPGVYLGATNHRMILRAKAPADE
jgi:SAM-dependent methyltransferase